MQFGDVGRQACDSTAKEGIRSLLGNGLSAYFFLLESVDCSSPLEVDVKSMTITSSSFEPTPCVDADRNNEQALDCGRFRLRSSDAVGDKTVCQICEEHAVHLPRIISRLLGLV